MRFAEQRLTGIPGRPPSLLDPPTGCRFRDRCPLAFEQCAARSRRSSPLEPGHCGRLLEGCRLMLLELDTCCKTYRTGAFGRGELLAVRDVCFACGPARSSSLIGESGSGKSTIGKMILRLLRPTRGAISVRRRRHLERSQGRQLKEYYRDVQGVFQDPFSSYNPIFKADRVFAMRPQRVLPGHDRGRVAGEARGVARGGQPQPGRRARQVPAPALAAASSSAC